MSTTPSPTPTHPLLGRFAVTPPKAEAEAVDARMDQWNSALRPWDDYELRLTHDVARETLRLERHHQREIFLRHAQAERADISWDEDRRGEADTLAAQLSRHPAPVIAQLRRTKHGCEVLAERWETLLATLDARGSWSAPERLLALNLLGVPPDLRKAITPLDAPAGADPVAHSRAVAAAQARRHRDLAAALGRIDDLERDAVRLGLGPDTPELAGLRKEERASARQLAWARAQFKATRREPRPPDRGDLPAYIPPARKSSIDDGTLDNDDLPPLRKSDGSTWPAPQSTAPPPPTDPSDPRRPPRGSPNPKSSRRRRRA